GAVPLLSDDDLGFVLEILALVLVRDVSRLTVDEHDHIGILFDGSRLAEVGELRPVVGTAIDPSIELRERQNGKLELLGDGLEAPGDLADLLLADIVATPSPAAQLQVVDHDEAQGLGLSVARGWYEDRSILSESAGAGTDLEDRGRGTVVDVQRSLVHTV